VGEDEAISGRTFGNVEEAANGGFSGVINKRRYARLVHGK
jgi:hypothetical protein